MLNGEGNGAVSLREMVRAMLEQAMAQARTQGIDPIAELHLTVYDPSPKVKGKLKQLVRELSVGTPAEHASPIIQTAPSRFICWNCCGLRFESDDPETACPNCGHEGWRIPPCVTFALDHIT